MQRPAGQPAWGQQQPWGQAQPAPGQQRPGWGPAQPAWGQPVAQQRPAQGYPQQYAPQAAYQGQPGGYPPPQPPPSGSPVKLVLLGLVAAIAVGFFAFSLMNFLNTGEQTVPEPLPTPEVGQTSAPPTGVPEPEMNPTDIPWPTEVAQAVDWLENNALYAQTLQVPTNCTLGRVSVLDSSDAALQEHLNLLTACLMMVWQGPAETAGFTVHRPPITLYSQPITTACGELETRNAFYCGGDQRLYFARDVYEIFGPNAATVAPKAFFVDNIMGHEFGHFLQGRIGVWGAYAGLRGGSDSQEFGLELSRRAETQADCLAGMFLNAVGQASQMTDAERREAADVTEAVGDDNLSGNPTVVGDHGHGVNRRHWFEQGLGNAQAAVCNTWTAPAEKIQ